MNELVRACLLIGDAMQISFHIPTNLLEISGTDEKLEAICQESQIQKRGVALKEGWWKKNHGPLLGFWGEEKKPVVLLFENHYQLIDKNQSKKVTESLAEEIAPAAYMFYAPIDPKVKWSQKIFHLIAIGKKKEVIFSLFCTLFYALFPSFAVKYFFQYAILENDSLLIFYLTSGLIFSAIGYALYHYFSTLFFLNIKGRSLNLILGAFWDRLLRLPSRIFHSYPRGNLASRVFSLEEIFNLADLSALNPLLSGVFSLLYFGAMLYFALPLALLVFFLSLIGLSIYFVCARLKMGVMRKCLEKWSAIQGALLQFVIGIGKLRTARAETQAFSHWASLFAKYQSERMKGQNLQTIAKTTTHFFPLLSLFFIYFAMLVWIPIKEISLPDFSAFMIAFGSFCLSIYPLGEAMVKLSDIFPLWERAKVFLEEKIEEPVRKPKAETLKGQIDIENLIYSFDPKIPPLFNGVSLSIQPGEFVGLIGNGKTTLLRLLLGLEKPLSGVIFLDEKDLWSLDLQSVRRQIGVYFQDLRVFSGHIYAVLKSEGTYSLEQLQAALAFSLFDRELASFPMKEMTGTNTLSGSQRARLFLSRASLGNPPILLLDEPVASLDLEARKIVNENIANWKGTCIYATNRTHNLRKCDRIYVFDEGKIAQTGTFEKLSNEPGLFATLLSKQS